MVKILSAETYLALLDIATYLCWYFIWLAHCICLKCLRRGFVSSAMVYCLSFTLYKSCKYWYSVVYVCMFNLLISAEYSFAGSNCVEGSNLQK